MPSLNDFERAEEKRELSRAQRRQAARQKHDSIVVTRKILTQVMDLYDDRYVRELRVRVAWLMLPWPKRHWLSLKARLAGARERVRARWSRSSGQEEKEADADET